MSSAQVWGGTATPLGRAFAASSAVPWRTARHGATTVSRITDRCLPGRNDALPTVLVTTGGIVLTGCNTDDERVAVLRAIVSAETDPLGLPVLAAGPTAGDLRRLLRRSAAIVAPMVAVRLAERLWPLLPAHTAATPVTGDAAALPASTSGAGLVVRRAAPGAVESWLEIRDATGTLLARCHTATGALELTSERYRAAVLRTLEPVVAAA